LLRSLRDRSNTWEFFSGGVAALEWEYIAPELLLEGSGIQDELFGRLRNDPPNSSMEVNYPFLHEGILRRFLSKIGGLAQDMAIYWKFGCWFYEQESQSQILIESGSKKDPKHPGRGWITLKAWGGKPQLVLDSLLKTLLEIPMVQQLEVVRSSEQTASQPEISFIEPDRPTIVPGKFDPNIDTEKQIFISFAWGDDKSEMGRKRSQVVEGLCTELEKEGYKILRDINQIRMGDQISDFMKRIGRGQRIIAILSDQYLRSPYCMTELHYIYQRSLGEKEDFLSRIIPVTLEDANIDTWRGRVKWAEH
jgi:internalin A